MVDGGEEVSSFGRFALGSPGAAQAGGGAEFEGLRMLTPRDFDAALEKRFRFLSIGAAVVKDNSASQSVQLRVQIVLAGLL